MCRTASDGWCFQVTDECAVLVMFLIAGACAPRSNKNLGHQSGQPRELLLFHMRDRARCPWCVTGLGRSPSSLSLRWGCREHFVCGCWHSPGRDYGRYPRECWLSTLGVLHPGVPVMWHTHIRDLSPTAEAVREAVRPM